MTRDVYRPLAILALAATATAVYRPSKRLKSFDDWKRPVLDPFFKVRSTGDRCAVGCWSTSNSPLSPLPQSPHRNAPHHARELRQRVRRQRTRRRAAVPPCRQTPLIDRRESDDSCVCSVAHRPRPNSPRMPHSHFPRLSHAISCPFVTCHLYAFVRRPCLVRRPHSSATSARSRRRLRLKKSS